MNGALPKVLVISHNAFSETGNMGKTMGDMLSCLPPENLAQLYFRSETPSSRVCGRYFRVSDVDVLRSVLDRKPRFTVFEAPENGGGKAGRSMGSAAAFFYRLGRRRTSPGYFLRNAMWDAGVWESGALWQWIEDFSPELIFFAAGDYVFSYKIAHRISERLDIPLLMWCCDDHYLRSGAPIRRKRLVKWAKKCVGRGSFLLVICDKMKKDYEKLFAVPAFTVRISAPEIAGPESNSRSGIVYAGNLGKGRHEVLLGLAKALYRAGIPGLDRVHIYTGERDGRILSALEREKGICLHGAVGKTELRQKLAGAKILLHLESFRERYRRFTRYSVSTKIAESLRSGAAIVCLGPRELASVEYLKSHGAALCAESAEEIPNIVKSLLEDESVYSRLVQNALALGRENHDGNINRKTMLDLLRRAAQKKGGAI